MYTNTCISIQIHLYIYIKIYEDAEKKKEIK